TGADGAFNPTVDRLVTLPDDGVLNYTSINIPAGVTVRFQRNTLNTPVQIRVSGNATIDGVIDVSGGDSAAVGTAGDGVIADDGIPGSGGPGGFDGGRGGAPGASGFVGGQGIGPGGGFPSQWQVVSAGVSFGCGGGGGGFAIDGGLGRYWGGVSGTCNTVTQTAGGGRAYGNERLLPLIGGSGGGGAAGGQTFAGSGGGGGGGAILIAASGTLTINGAIRANGGRAGASAGTGTGGAGRGGGGGAIRLIASTLAGNGALSAIGGIGATNEPVW
ncbi:MAG TPA: hypothetical protein DDZ76_09735, partial [Xanthomonadales bacterium]|nr:hypothetical protein [Xanthomonadales bacterium]